MYPDRWLPSTCRSISAPHHGHCVVRNLDTGIPLDNAFLSTVSAWFSEFGVTAPPSQAPIDTGAKPNSSLWARRISSSAQISEDARWNCCDVSRRSVYLISTLTPLHCLSPFFRRVRRSWRMAKAARPKYASVLPPPVGIHITSLRAFFPVMTESTPGGKPSGTASIAPVRPAP